MSAADLLRVIVAGQQPPDPDPTPEKPPEEVAREQALAHAAILFPPRGPTPSEPVVEREEDETSEPAISPANHEEGTAEAVAAMFRTATEKED
jgi:hypothetical protein